MEHFSSDCWNLNMNCLCSWTKCSGLANRTTYNFTNHSEKSENELPALDVLSKSKHKERFVLNKRVLARAVRKNTQVIMMELDDIAEKAISKLRTKMGKDCKAEVASFKIFKDPAMLTNESIRVKGI